MADLPDILNVRFSRVDTELAELKEADAVLLKKVNTIERSMAELRTDVRDLRGGVTRQLTEQDKRLAEIDAKLDAIMAKLNG